jgi:hypothetical protein
MKAEIYVRGRRLIAVDTNVVRLPPQPQPERADPLTEAQALTARYEALSRRDRNYRSAIYADLLCDVLKRLAASCTPLREERAREMADILRRAEYGDGPASALAAQERTRHLRAVGEAELGEDER